MLQFIYGKVYPFWVYSSVSSEKHTRSPVPCWWSARGGSRLPEAAHTPGLAAPSAVNMAAQVKSSRFESL